MEIINDMNFNKFLIAIAFAVLFYGCMFDQLGSHKSIKISSFCILNKEIKILLESHRYKYEKSISALLMGELPGQIPLNKKFIELKGDVNFLKNNGMLNRLPNEEIISFKKPKGYIRIKYVSGKDLITYTQGENESVICNIINTITGLVVKQLKSSDSRFGLFSNDNTKIYYFKTKNLFLYDVTNSSEEKLSDTAYKYVLRHWEELTPTSIKYFFIIKKGDEFNIIDIRDGKIIGGFHSVNREYICDVDKKGDEIIIITMSFLDKSFYVRNSEGEMINKLKLNEGGISFKRYACDILNNRVGIISLEKQNVGTRNFKGYLDLIIWDYVKNDSNRFKIQVDF